MNARDGVRAPTTLDRLTAVSLEDLAREASLLTRVDRKYVLTPHDLDAVLAALPSAARVLEIDGQRRFDYESPYLDLPGLRSYRDAAHRRPRRWKVRTRRYVATGAVFLEVKVRRGRQTLKERIPGHALAPLDVVARDFVETAVGRHGLGLDAAGLVPTLGTAYRRVTVQLPSTASRVTLDTDLAWTDLTVGARLTCPRLVVVETKTDGRPCEVDRSLWELGHRPSSLSKYAVGLAALRPGLPRNRWHRLLAGDALASPVPLDPQEVSLP